MKGGERKCWGNSDVMVPGAGKERAVLVEVALPGGRLMVMVVVRLSY